MAQATNRMDKEALLPALVAAAPVVGKGTMAALWALMALQSGRRMVTKNIPGMARAAYEGDWKRATGEGLQAALNASMLVPGAGSLKTFRNLPNMYRMRRVMQSAPAQQAIAGRMLLAAKAGKPLSRRAASASLLKSRVPGVSAKTMDRASLRAVEEARGLQKNIDAFNKTFDNRVTGLIPGYRRFMDSSVGRFAKHPAVSFPGFMAASTVAESLAPSAESMPEAAARGAVIPAAYYMYGPSAGGGYMPFMQGLTQGNRIPQPTFR